MIETSSPRVVIAGGGVAALETLIALRDLAGDRVDITLVAPEESFVYRPMTVAVPFAAGHANRYGAGPHRRPVRRAARPGRRRLGRSRRSRSSAPASGERIPYDHLVLATGARATPAYAQAITFGEDVEEEALHGLLRDTEEGYVERVAFVVPNETTWALPLYELALMTARQAWTMGADRVRFLFVTPEERPLAIFGGGSERRGRRAARVRRDRVRRLGLHPGRARPPDRRPGRPADRRRPRRQPAAARGHADPGRPGRRRRLHPRRRARPRGRPRRRLRRGRRDRVPDQAGRPRHPAGRRGRGDDRRGSRRAGRAASRSGPCCAACSSPGATTASCAPAWRAARASPTSRPTPSGGRRPRSRAATSPRSCSAATSSTAIERIRGGHLPVEADLASRACAPSPCHDGRARAAGADRRRRRALGPLARRARPGPDARAGRGHAG